MIAKLMQFNNEIRAEFAKIYWPKLNATISTSAIVAFTAAMIGLFFTGFDKIISMMLLVIFRVDV